MNIDHRSRQTQKWFHLFISICILILNLGAVQTRLDCPVIYNGGNGWTIDMCTTDPAVTTPMQIFVDGVSHGSAAVVRIYHRSQSGPGTPQIAVIYASGYVRLKQNADPSPAIPFGTSFILGPAYWPSSSTYYHNPQLNQLKIDTTRLPNAPLRMRAQGTNHKFAVSYEMTLPPPRDRQTRLHVSQTYTATANVNIDPTRRSEQQGFKLVQASSMFINEGAACDGGYTDCHDSNGARFIGNDLVRHQTAFTDLTLPALIFATPVPLGSTWLDVLHTDDQSWQSQTGGTTSGNTPNVRIALDDLPTAHTITPQGWIASTTDPNDDNVGMWLHDDGPASASWQAGQSGKVGYWLLVQDDPPEPWSDLGLRPGSTLLDFEGSSNCFPVTDALQSTTGTVTTIAGYSDTALQLNYDLGSDNGNWAQVRCNFDPPLDLSAYDHLRFDWRGDPSAANSLQVGLINPTEGGENIFARGYHHATQRAWWGQMVVPFEFLEAWTSGTEFDPSQVSALFLSVVKDPVADVGGAGSIALDNLSAYDVSSRTVPPAFETVDSNQTAAQAAANWLASQQKSTGLLKSWQEESSCAAHTYDQALALIVFVDQGMWHEADALVDGLAAIQNEDGSWFKSHDCNTREVIGSDKWEGDIAWAVYALGRYLNAGGMNARAVTALKNGADWLATRVNPADGCLLIDHTEGTLDAWWAFQAAGASHTEDAEKIKNCLLTYYWDESMGRFKGGREWQQPYLDNQTWGAAFLKAIGETGKALRALSYARETMQLSAQGGQLFGFDGQAGPWSVWNEGTAQYVAVGGEGANDFLSELLAQQQKNGALVGSPDEFNGGGVWTTRWHGVAPTAWLYNALRDEPFHPGNQWLEKIPVLSAPTDGEVLLHRRPKFDWSDVPGASNYQIVTSKSDSFDTLLWKVTTTDSTYTPPADLPAGKVIYWRVHAKVGGTWSLWSETWHFTTGTPPSIPVLVSPATASLTRNYTPKLEWNDSTVPTGTAFDHYEVQVSLDKFFTDPVLLGEVTPSGEITTSFYAPTTDLAANTKYFWRVCSFNTDEEYSSWSTVWSFRTALLPPGNLSPDSITVTGRKPVLNWEAVEGAEGYTVQISTDSGFATLLVNTPVTTNTFTPVTNLPTHTTIYWRVQTAGVNGPSRWTKASFNTP